MNLPTFSPSTQDRKGYIGSTDAIKIMEDDNLYDLWRIKTGRLEPEDLSDVLPVQLGIYTEEFNIAWFDHHMSRITTDRQKKFEQTVQNVPCRTEVDGIVYDGLVECKHTNAFNNMDDMIAHYMPQVQFAMMLSNKSRCYLSVIFGNSKWECASIDYNQDYCNTMMNNIKLFWSYVINDHEPDHLLMEQPATDSILVNEMVRRDASKDNEFMSLANDYLDNQTAAKTFEATKKELKKLVAANEREVYSPILTIKRDKRGALRFST